MKYLAFQLRSALAELLLSIAMALDPSTVPAVLRAYRDLWVAKVAAMDIEL